MKKGDKRKQRKKLKRRSGHNQASRQTQTHRTVPGYIRHARNYPIGKCWVSKGWREGGIAVVVVSRRQPNDNIVFGTYLVDYYCMGLKNTYCNADIPAGVFRRKYLPEIFSEMGPVKISPALAHEIVYGSIEFAGQFGFRPQRDFKRSKLVLDPPDTHPRTGTVEFGLDGKPFYIDGPYDNAQAILRQLERTAGAGNYDYVTQVDKEVIDDWD